MADSHAHLTPDSPSLFRRLVSSKDDCPRRQFREACEPQRDRVLRLFVPDVEERASVEVRQLAFEHIKARRALQCEVCV